MTSSAPHGVCPGDAGPGDARPRRRTTRRRRTRRPRAHRTTGRRRRVQRGQAGHSGYVQEQRYRAACRSLGTPVRAIMVNASPSSTSYWRAGVTTSRRRPRTVTVSPVTITCSRCCLQASWPGSALSAPSTTSTCSWPWCARAPRTRWRTTPSPAPGVLSGAHALWLLDGPDRVERQKRGLCLAHEEFFREHQAVRDIAAIQNSDPVRGLTAMKDYPTRAWSGWTGRWRPARRSARPRKRSRPSTKPGCWTRWLTASSSTIPRNVELISAVRIVWRTYSGVAHGLRWPVRYRTKYGEPIPGSRPGTVEHGRGAGHQQHRRPGYGRLQHQHLPDQRDQVIEKRRQPAHR